MKQFKVAVSWEMCGELAIEAETMEEAIEIANDPETDLSEGGEYIDSSFEVNEDMTEYLNKNIDTRKE